MRSKHRLERGTKHSEGKAQIGQYLLAAWAVTLSHIISNELNSIGGVIRYTCEMGSVGRGWELHVHQIL